MRLPRFGFIYFAKTLILKDYEERRYPSVNQACIEVEYEMPEQEEVVEEEDSDEEEGSFKKVMDWEGFWSWAEAARWP